MNVCIIFIVFLIGIICCIFLFKNNYTYNNTECLIEGIASNNPSFQLFLINLDRRPDRLNLSIKLLKQYNFNDVLRFPAIDGKKLSQQDLKTIVRPDAIQPILDNKRTQHYELSYGAVACYLSHVELWKRMINEDLSYIIVFEDDTNPSKTSGQVLNYIRNLPNDWDIFLLGGIYDTEHGIDENVCKITGQFYQTHAYCIRNTPNVKRCVDESIPIYKQIDSWLSDLVFQNKINIYGLSDRSWKSQLLDTDIQTPIN